jgi:hypothetical protein
MSVVFHFSNNQLFIFAAFNKKIFQSTLIEALRFCVEKDQDPHHSIRTPRTPCNEYAWGGTGWVPHLLGTH